MAELKKVLDSSSKVRTWTENLCIGLIAFGEKPFMVHGVGWYVIFPLKYPHDTTNNLG